MEHIRAENLYVVPIVSGDFRNGPPGWGTLKNRINKVCSTENYRPGLLSERAPHIIKFVTV
jgi:hypothetical protein